MYQHSHGILPVLDSIKTYFWAVQYLSVVKARMPSCLCMCIQHILHLPLLYLHSQTIRSQTIEAFLAETSFTSPRKLFIYIIKNMYF